jgi:outer membrane lipoprotein-sorting protein
MIVRTFRRFAVAALLALAAATPVHADPKADIMAAHGKMMEKGRFRMTGTSVAGDQTTRMESAVVWPDRYHMKMDGAGGINEIIVIPGETWMKQGGSWMKLPMDMSAMIQSLTPEAMRKSFEGMTNVRELGSESIGGRDAVGYAYDSKVEIMGITSTSSVRLWVDEDTGLPLRQEIDGKAMGVSSKTVQDYVFDPAVEVRAPK